MSPKEQKYDEKSVFWVKSYRGLVIINLALRIQINILACKILENSVFYSVRDDFLTKSLLDLELTNKYLLII